MSGAIGQRVDALEVQASQADELVANRLAPAQFTAMARRQANTEMRLRHAEEQVRAQEERTGACKIHVDKVAARFEAKVFTLQQLVDTIVSMCLLDFGVVILLVTWASARLRDAYMRMRLR